MIPTLYLTRNGLLEPLGQSQVFSYLHGLSKDYAITLITYEKPEDFADSAQMEQAQEACKRDGIRWLPQIFHRKTHVIVPALSLVRMVWLLLREVRAGHANLIHVRSYIPAAAALLVQRLTGTPFIFDMRALWPEELITAGRFAARIITAPGNYYGRTRLPCPRSCGRISDQCCGRSPEDGIPHGARTATDSNHSNLRQP